MRSGPVRKLAYACAGIRIPLGSGVLTVPVERLARLSRLLWRLINRWVLVGSLRAAGKGRVGVLIGGRYGLVL